LTQYKGLSCADGQALLNKHIHTKKKLLIIKDKLLKIHVTKSVQIVFPTWLSATPNPVSPFSFQTKTRWKSRNSMQ